MIADGLPDLVEQLCRDCAVEGRAAAFGQADVRTGPDEAIEFGDDHPASIIVEAKVLLHSGRELDAIRIRLRLRVGHRCNQQLRSVVVDCGSQDDHSGPVFQPFFLPGRIFIRPKIGVCDDVTGLRNRP